MGKENISQEFRLKNRKEINNYPMKETDQNKLVSKDHKKFFAILNYIDHLFILASAITGYVSLSDFACLVSIPIGITFSAKGLKICTMNSGIKKYQSISMKKKKNMKK